MPSRQTGHPPTCASITTAVSASAMPAQRSSVVWSWSATARITVRMSNAFLRSGLLAGEKISPTVWKSLSGALWGYGVMSRSYGSLVGARRGPASPGTTYVCAWCSISTSSAAGRLGAQYCAWPFGPITRS
jgi:hypothetical protein